MVSSSSFPLLRDDSSNSSPAAVVGSNDQNKNVQTPLEQHWQHSHCHQRIVRQPFGTFWWDQLRFLSPYTWRGAALVRNVDWQWKNWVMQSLLAVVPAAAWYYYCSTTASRWSLSSSQPAGSRGGEGSQRNNVVLKGLLATFKEIIGNNNNKYPWLWWWISSCVIPHWSLSCWWKATRGMRSVALATWNLTRFSGNQATTHPDALTILADRITTGQAFRSRRYDVYWPPSFAVLPSSSSGGTLAAPTNALPCSIQQQHQQEAILLFPGLGVDHAAYAHVAGILSDAGFVVVVVSAEPLRAPCIALGCDAVSMRRIQAQVVRARANHYYRNKDAVRNDDDDDMLWSWSLLGHSMGGFAVTHLAGDLNIPRMVLWATAPAFYRHMADLSSSSSDQRHHKGNLLYKCLVIQASNDSFMTTAFSTPEMVEQFQKRLAPDTTTRTIMGGTHDGFANYTSAFAIVPPPEENNVVQAMPRLAQQQQAVEWTIQFIRQHANAAESGPLGEKELYRDMKAW